MKRFLPNFARKGERKTKETGNPRVERGRDRGARGIAQKKGKKRVEADYAESYSPLILLECTRERGNISINYCVIKI